MSKCELDVERMITGMYLKFLLAFSSFRVSRPSFTGMFRSSMIRSGLSWWLLRCVNTSSPPGTSSSLNLTRVDFNASENNSRSTASSSANNRCIGRSCFTGLKKLITVSQGRNAAMWLEFIKVQNYSELKMS